MDDITVFSVDDAVLLQVFDQFFSMYCYYNLKLHPWKCEFCPTVVLWCGCLTSKDGIQFDPRNMDILLSMEPPTQGGKLEKFLCTVKWVAYLYFIPSNSGYPTKRKLFNCVSLLSDILGQPDIVKLVLLRLQSSGYLSGQLYLRMFKPTASHSSISSRRSEVDALLGGMVLRSMRQRKLTFLSLTILRFS